MNVRFKTSLKYKGSDIIRLFKYCVKSSELSSIVSNEANLSNLLNLALSLLHFIFIPKDDSQLSFKVTIAHKYKLSVIFLLGFVILLIILKVRLKPVLNLPLNVQGHCKNLNLII